MTNTNTRNTLINKITPLLQNTPTPQQLAEQIIDTLLNETKWEYGVQQYALDFENWETDSLNQIIALDEQGNPEVDWTMKYETEEKARKIADYGYLGQTLVKRIKAGPWVPVNTPTTETTN